MIWAYRDARRHGNPRRTAAAIAVTDTLIHITAVVFAKFGRCR